MRKIKKVNLEIKKICHYIEDYCCVVTFASDDTVDPKCYLILTRQSTEFNGGDPVEDFEWQLVMADHTEVHELTGYYLEFSKIIFNFDHKRFQLILNIGDHPIKDIEKRLDFIFQGTELFINQ
ncbi:hypothetical protein EC844_1133 [Acinetobacter calcoaceticus]|uniref:Uncharacterized protein n=1 Tax=Acinetobacter calcoaceticus TaxID=471 RepID=A0A4R1Y2X8_ACICA|nr:hypothetical protein EC844_1133 [Acinetobacter calcoaceticus]